MRKLGLPCQYAISGASKVSELMKALPHVCCHSQTAHTPHPTPSLPSNNRVQALRLFPCFMVADVMSSCWRDLCSDGYPTWRDQPWTTCPSSQLPIHPEHLSRPQLWLLAHGLPQATGSQKENVCHIYRVSKGHLFFSVATESLPQGDELMMTTSSFIMLKASQLSFSFVFGHSTEPETGKEKSEDIRHPWEAWRWQRLADMGPQ